MNPFLDYLLAAIPLGMVFLFGCVGEIITEKAGHLNLGIPGIMCIGGASGCMTLALLRNSGLPPFLIVALAILASFGGGTLMGLLYSFLTVTLKANQNITGLAMTIFGAGTSKFIMLPLSGGLERGMPYLYALPYFRFPFENQNSSLNLNGVAIYLAIVIAAVSAVVLSRTRVGLHLRSVGENPATADAVGINVTRYKYVATCIGSGIAALGGLFYIMDYSGSPDAYLNIEAFGWLAVALVIFTLWKPLISIVGSILFGMFYQLSGHIPAILTFMKLPQLNMTATRFLQTLPYIVTVIVLIVTSVRKKRENQPPASLGISYFREER